MSVESPEQFRRKFNVATVPVLLKKEKFGLVWIKISAHSIHFAVN